MGMSEKEKSRRYRERLKADPEKQAERNRKKRESYHKNKKLISNMTPEDQKNLFYSYFIKTCNYMIYHFPT